MKREVVGSYPVSLVLIYSYLPSTLIYCVPSLVRCALTLVLPRSPCLPTYITYSQYQTTPRISRAYVSTGARDLLC